MFTISQIRAQARETISKTPGMYLLILIPVLISVAFQLISSGASDPSTIASISSDPSLATSYLIQTSIFPILISILLAFLFLSVSYTVFQIVNGQKESTGIKDSFAIFSHPQFGKVFATVFLKAVLLFVWGLVLFIGVFLLIFVFAFILGYTLEANITDPSQLPDEALGFIGIAILVGFLLTIAGFALYIPQVYAYSQVEFILFDRLQKDQYTTASAVIKDSRSMMKGYKGKRFVLDLTFIGWFVLISLTFGIVGIYVYPYYYTAQVHFHKAVLAERQQLANFGFK